MSEKVKTLMQALEEACGVTGKDIYAEDGKIDYREDLAMSKVEVETKPSEAPTENQQIPQHLNQQKRQLKHLQKTPLKHLINQ